MLCVCGVFVRRDRLYDNNRSFKSQYSIFNNILVYCCRTKYARYLIIYRDCTRNHSINGYSESQRSVFRHKHVFQFHLNTQYLVVLISPTDAHTWCTLTWWMLHYKTVRTELHLQIQLWHFCVQLKSIAMLDAICINIRCRDFERPTSSLMHMKE